MPLELLINARNLSLSEAEREYLRKRLRPIERHMPGPKTARVVFRQEGRQQDRRIVAEINLDLDGLVLRVEERAPTVTSAIDLMAQTLDQKLERMKGRIYTSLQAKKAGRNVSIRTLEAERASASEEAEALPDGKVVRVKRFPMKPMTVEEAIFEMELLGHDFFLFHNAETDQYNVLYRRRDGNYGLIEPEPM